MNQKQRQAYEWSENQNYPSVAARYAKILAGLVDEITPPNEPERAGLYGKYTVYRNKDGSLVTDCFILRPAKDPAAVAALRAYAAATDNAELAADIINWVGAEPNEPLTLEQLRASPHGKIKDSTLQNICNRANEIACRPPEGEA